MRVIDLALKDLSQIVRDWKAAVFLLVMPIIFTLFFGMIFGGTSQADVDPRLPVGIVDQDNWRLSPYLLELLENSEVIRIQTLDDASELEKKIADEDFAAGIVIPAGYSASLLDGEPVALTLTVDPASNAAVTIEGEIQAAVNRLLAAVRTAEISAQAYASQQAFADDAARQAYFDDALARTVAAWATPPVTIQVTKTGESPQAEQPFANSYAHSSPGMMAQFAIVGLMGAAEVIVRERKTRTLQRLLTTAISRFEILVGHYLAMFMLIFAQFVILIAFGQLFLELHYENAWGATALMAVSMALACASMGLLIGTLAKSEEQTIMLTMIPMFVFAGLGGAWVPLEITSPTVQAISHFSPVAWMMDGFKNILVRGQGLREALLPAGVLLAFAVGFFVLGAWRFRTVSE
ncbi:MAG: hypothetical protein C0393_05650 [Anaerolinea sp.]|nr:hypothetical protein [Anaerolinea sp.]